MPSSFRNSDSLATMWPRLTATKEHQGTAATTSCPFAVLLPMDHALGILASTLTQQIGISIPVTLCGKAITEVVLLNNWSAGK